MINVVAALIWQDDKILICKRPKHKSLPLMWEFPGGKIEDGETTHGALKREIKEELDVEIITGYTLGNTIYHYEDFSVCLTFINAVIVSGKLKSLEHEEIKWVNISELGAHEFCSADEEILDKLKIVHLLD